MSIFPDSNQVSSYSAETSNTGRKTFKFDFSKREFVTNVNNQVLTAEDESEILKETVSKILYDDRYKYLIYSDDYGNEINNILAQDLTEEVLISEIKRAYTEALAYHPKIESIEDMNVYVENNKIYAEFTVVGKYGAIIKIQKEVE